MAQLVHDESSAGLPGSGTADDASAWRGYGVNLAAQLYILTMLACYPLTYVSRTYLHGYPLTYVSRTYLHGQSPTVKHAYFTLCGVVLMFMNFGYDVSHSAISILVNYVLLVTIGGSQLSVALSFVFNMTYLVTAYAFLSTDGYDLIWTTPHCVLTLKLIGTAFDLYDGHQKEETLSTERKQLNIKTPPSLLELSGYIYFIGGCFAAPLFSIRRYRDFTAEKLLDNDKGLPPDCIMPAMNRLAVGFLYLIAYMALSPVFPNAYLMSPEFANSSFLYQAFVLMVWGKMVFFKYSIVYLLTEGACIMSGLTYNGKDGNGNALWDACASLKPVKCELATCCRDLVPAHNITTNVWVLRYVYKRLKFLNNRTISQIATLFFLALWHGLFVGYYVGFALEFFVFLIESQVVDASRRSTTLARIASSASLKIPLWVALKAWTLFSVGHALTPIVLLRWRRVHLVYSAMYYIPLGFYIGFPLLYQFVIQPQLKKMEGRTKDTAAVKDRNGETSKTK